jgi:hypothetical protein
MAEHPNRRRNRVSVAIALAILIAALAMVALGIADIVPQDIRDAFHSTPLDGSWKAVSFDGLPVRSKNYLVVIRRGEVVGGYDDCNGWSYQDENPDERGERKVLSTLVSCAADDDIRRLYHMLVYSPQIESRGKNALLLSRGAHVGTFHRCTPDRERLRCVEVR